MTIPFPKHIRKIVLIISIMLASYAALLAIIHHSKQLAEQSPLQENKNRLEEK